MTTKANDIVLGLTRWILKIGTWLFLGLAVLLALVAIGVPVAIVTGIATDAIKGSDIPPDMSMTMLAGAVFVMVGLGSGLMLLLWRFTAHLRDIVETVDSNPFVQENAVRLRQMGWLAVASYPLVFLMMIAAMAIEHGVKSAEVKFDFSLDIGGLLLIFLLFILARVFEQGVVMREELEGTV